MWGLNYALLYGILYPKSQILDLGESVAPDLTHIEFACWGSISLCLKKQIIWLLNPTNA